MLLNLSFHLDLTLFHPNLPLFHPDLIQLII